MLQASRLPLGSSVPVSPRGTVRTCPYESNHFSFLDCSILHRPMAPAPVASRSIELGSGTLGAVAAIRNGAIATIVNNNKAAFFMVATILLFAEN